MNDPTTDHELPQLSDESRDRIEHAVFARIAEGRAPAPQAARPRRRRLLTGIGIAAAFVVGLLVTPIAMQIAGETTAMSGTPDISYESSGDYAAQDAAGSDASVATADGEIAGREVISTARADVAVADVADAAAALTALAEKQGGYVTSTQVPGAGAADDSTLSSRSGWVSIRVPADALTDTIDALAEIGEVRESAVSQDDVTATAIDLRARIDAAQASVDRLTELMAQSGSVSELIEAEVALTDRQAELESYTQQLASLEDQVAMSTLDVTLTPRQSTGQAEPNRFLDGLLTGWNGLVASLNALIITVGFLLPWAVLAGIVLFVVRIVIRRRRRARTIEDR